MDGTVIVVILSIPLIVTIIAILAAKKTEPNVQNAHTENSKSKEFQNKQYDELLKKATDIVEQFQNTLSIMNEYAHLSEQLETHRPKSIPTKTILISTDNAVNKYFKYTHDSIDIKIKQDGACTMMLLACHLAQMIISDIDIMLSNNSLPHYKLTKINKLRDILSSHSDATKQKHLEQFHQLLNETIHQQCTIAITGTDNIITQCRNYVYKDIIENINNKNIAKHGPLPDISNYISTNDKNWINNIIDDLTAFIKTNRKDKDNVSTEDEEWLDIWASGQSYVFDFCQIVIAKIYLSKLEIELLLERVDLLIDHCSYSESDEDGDSKCKTIVNDALKTIDKINSTIDELTQFNDLGMELNEKVYQLSRHTIGYIDDDDDDDDLDLKLMDAVNEFYDLNQFVIKFIPNTKDRILAQQDNIDICTMKIPDIDN